MGLRNTRSHKGRYYYYHDDDDDDAASADSGTREPAKPVVPPVYTSASHLMKCAPKLLSGSSSSVSKLGEVNPSGKSIVLFDCF